MREDNRNPQINVSKIVVGGGIAGAIFTLGSMSIFLTGLPLLWVMFPAALVVGSGVALSLHFLWRKSGARTELHLQ
jgi:hypothetical protein